MKLKRSLKILYLHALHTPPLLFILCSLPATVDYFIRHHKLGLFHFENFSWWQIIPACILCFIGILIALNALYEFHHHQVSPLPFTIKRQEIVMTGIYTYSRNPMYLSLLFLHSSLTLALSPWYLVITGPLLFILLSYEIKREEHKLTKLCSEYRTYQDQVRRWI